MMLGIFCYTHAYILESCIYYSIYGMKAKNDNIGHTAHFGAYRRLFDYIAQRTFIVSRSYVNGAVLAIQ
jgi:hypothetical protein